LDLKNVSIVIVNYNGRHHLRECFNSILKLHYPKDKIEVVVVDNGSTDGSVELMQQKFSWVKLLRNSKNEGFAKPSNDGARAATGDYVAFINNDMRVQKDWLIELINSMQNSGAKCAGSVILNWNGDFLDFGGGGVNFQGIGFQADFQRPMRDMEPLLTADKEILFACGGSMIIERELFLFTGGFDEDYFAYYEDVDLGWRLRVLGCKIVLSVKSRVYHKHNSTSKTITKARIQYLFERNKLYTCYKNYGEELFNKVFFPSILLEIRETYMESRIDGYNYNIKNPGAFNNDPVQIGQMAAMKLSALNEFVENISRTSKKREFIQQNRKTSDDEIVNYLNDPFIVFPKDTAEFLNTEYDIVKIFGIDKLLKSELKCKVMLFLAENVDESTSIRYQQIAKSLVESNKFKVIIACPDSYEVSLDGVEKVTYSQLEHIQLKKTAREANVVMLTGAFLEAMPDLKPIIEKKYVIMDMVNSPALNSIELNKNEDRPIRNVRQNEVTSSLDYQIKFGDFFTCANEKQRDYLAGMLFECGKVAPMFYETDSISLAKNYNGSEIIQPIIDFCSKPMHYASREETENISVSAATSTGGVNLERGSLQERLVRIEQNQQKIEQLLRADSRIIRQTHLRSRELTDWSSLMESRFEKFKAKLGRFKILRRFIK
jgi:GT2 family glycosyltransferase